MPMHGKEDIVGELGPGCICSSHSENGFMVFRGDSGVEYEGEMIK